MGLGSKELGRWVLEGGFRRVGRYSERTLDELENEGEISARKDVIVEDCWWVQKWCEMVVAYRSRSQFWMGAVNTTVNYIEQVTIQMIFFRFLITDHKV